MTASNWPASVYFHLENTFSVGGVAEGGSGGKGLLVLKGLWQVSLSNVNVLLQGLFFMPDCWKPNFSFLSLNLIGVICRSFGVIERDVYSQVSPPHGKHSPLLCREV